MILIIYSIHIKKWPKTRKLMMDYANLIDALGIGELPGLSEENRNRLMTKSAKNVSKSIQIAQETSMRHIRVYFRVLLRPSQQKLPSGLFVLESNMTGLNTLRDLT